MKNKLFELTYPAKIERDDKGYLVKFNDISNAFTWGESFEEALYNAQEVLDLILLDRIENNEDIPLPSAPMKGDIMVTASPDTAAPILLHLLRESKHRTITDVARRMGGPYQSYQRLESGKNLTMKSIKRAAAAMGAVVEIRIRTAN